MTQSLKIEEADYKYLVSKGKNDLAVFTENQYSCLQCDFTVDFNVVGVEFDWKLIDFDWKQVVKKLVTNGGRGNWQGLRYGFNNNNLQGLEEWWK